VFICCDMAKGAQPGPQALPGPENFEKRKKKEKKPKPPPEKKKKKKERKKKKKKPRRPRGRD